MKTLLQLRSEIELILTTEIGSYKFSSGQIVPSCCVLPDSIFGWDFPPPGTLVEDLEIIIIPNAKIKERAILTGSYVNYSTQINLKQWNPQKTTINATKLIINNLRENLDVRPRILPNASLENIETQTIFINNPVVCNWSP